jgi:hydroxymethylpyrimidine pyrophosphatase-like HAD family hydrolase
VPAHEMTREEYEKLRSDARTFAVVSGREILDVEEIVERYKTFDVVRKTASDAVSVVEATDPR